MATAANKPYLANNKQQDSEEFMTALLSELKRNGNGAIGHFFGKEMVLLKFLHTSDGSCHKCKQISRVEAEPFLTLKLSVPDTKESITVSSIVQEYFAEQLEFMMKCSSCCKCPQGCSLIGPCKQRPAARQNILTRSPDILILQFLRFKPPSKEKVQTKILHDKFLELPNHVKYHLEASTDHWGPQISGGHYVLYIKDEMRWLLCNDDKVHEVDSSRLQGSNTYMLIYRKYKETSQYPVFVPSADWQEVHEWQAIPPGLKIQLNIQTGQRFAKIDEHYEKPGCVNIVRESQTSQTNSNHRVDDKPEKAYRKSKSMASKAWEPLMPKTRSKTNRPLGISPSKTSASTPSSRTSASTRSPRPSASIPPSRPSVVPPNRRTVIPTLLPFSNSESSGTKTPSTTTQATCISNSLVDDTSLKESTPPNEESEVLKQMIVDPGFTGLSTFNFSQGFPQNDGLKWNLKCSRKGKGAAIFVCIEAGCAAEKKVIKRPNETRRKGKTDNHPITVKYMANHTCNEIPKMKNILLSSYYSQKKTIILNKGSNKGEETENGRKDSSEVLVIDIDDAHGSTGSNLEKEKESPGVDSSEQILKDTDEDQGNLRDSPVSATETDFVEQATDANENSFSELLIDIDDWETLNEQNVDACILGARSNSNLNDARRKSPEVDSVKFICYICTFETSCVDDYDNHIISDHDMLCLACDYQTTTIANLNAHMKTHKELVIEVTNEAMPKSDSRKRKRVLSDIFLSDIILPKMKKKNIDKEGSFQDKFEMDEEVDDMDYQTNPDGSDDLTNAAMEALREDGQVSDGYSGDNSVENDEIRAQGRIQTKSMIEYEDMDMNCGNVAFVMSDYLSKKKPSSNRKHFNWGTSHSQRGHTTVYPCAGHFACDNCEWKSLSKGSCSKCNILLVHKQCPAKKYVYACENSCVRSIYKDCCNFGKSQRKLVVLYVEKHICQPFAEKEIVSLLKQVECKDDLIENLNMIIKNETVEFSVEAPDKIPNDINGNKFYILDNRKNCQLKDIIRDGRKWQIYTQTTSKQFSAAFNEKTIKKTRKYRCSNQYFCFYKECAFKKRFEIINQIQWTMDDNGHRRCVSCSEKMEPIKCQAEKFVAKSDDNKFVVIKHIGLHKCLHKTKLESQIIEEIEDFFTLNPTATRSEAIVHHLVTKINFGSKEDVINVVNVSLNIWEINNAKQKGLKRLNPYGNKLDAIRHLKEKLIEIGNPFNIILNFFDDVYICEACNFISEQEGKDESCVKFCMKCSMVPMEHVGPSIFISSKDSLATLRELRSMGALGSEACCLDHQPSRLREFTTFAAYCYDTDLRKMCPLFASVMTNEREMAVYHTLDVVDRCMKEEFATENHFNPNLIIADEATAIKNAVSRKLGIEKVQKQYGTCQLHFKGSVLQHCSFAIGNQTEIWQFMKLSEHLMTAESPDIYEMFKTELVQFISQTEPRHAHLYNWLEFYDQRRSGWSNAFRNPELPQSNKGEAGNSHYSAVTHLTGLTLDLGVKCMVAEMHVYAGCRRGITTGQYKGRSGPTRVKMDEKLVQECFDRIQNTQLTSENATVFVAELLDKIGLKKSQNVTESTEGHISEEEPMSKQTSVLQTHKFLADQIQARTNVRIDSPKFINAPHKKIGKKKIRFADTLKDLESDGKKQAEKNRKGATKESTSLNDRILKTLSEGFTVKTVETGVYTLTVNGDEKRCYTVNLKEQPSCTCPESDRILQARPRDRNTLVCKHIPCMMLCLGFDFNSQILRRYAHNATEQLNLKVKITSFQDKNIDVAEIKKKIENEMSEKLELDLPYFDAKKYYGQFKSYTEAKFFYQ